MALTRIQPHPEIIEPAPKQLFLIKSLIPDQFPVATTPSNAAARADRLRRGVSQWGIEAVDGPARRSE